MSNPKLEERLLALGLEMLNIRQQMIADRTALLPIVTLKEHDYETLTPVLERLNRMADIAGDKNGHKEKKRRTSVRSAPAGAKKKLKRTHITDHHRNAVVAGMAAKKSYAQIAVELGVSHTTVQRIARKVVDSTAAVKV